MPVVFSTMMFKGWWHVLPDEERQQWALEPFVAMGPLRFGMSPEEVAGAMAAVATEVERRQHQWAASTNVSTVVKCIYKRSACISITGMTGLRAL
ncbi:hypothetical protein [Actinoplanes aureus]|uniref:Uncharacterized protein n=1 Tax=Actinoplanes aureus TaxID=2792083 RepID=A0A931CJR9_9ACTN|nr:hypothetical protein [Actinoplanes aureus]MBG0568643.1 hypothetical protein [Actinoplanes aureus]